jgi:nitric oxide reductase subunit C
MFEFGGLFRYNRQTEQTQAPDSKGERMTVRQAKHIFIWGTVASAVIFLGLTVDSLIRMPKRTVEIQLAEAVARGKWVWQIHNCNDCHTILGIGGYYAPDVTKVMATRDPDWMGRFLRDPAGVWPNKRQMPNLRLGEAEIADTIAFLSWVNGIDTNNWPPAPLAVAAPGAAGRGGELFRALGCTGCHALGGLGGQSAPTLDGVGGRLDRSGLERQIVNPQSRNPDTIMPSYSQVPRQDLEALVDFLLGQK